MERMGWLLPAVVVSLAGCVGVMPPESAERQTHSASSTPATSEAGPLLMLGLLPGDAADVTYTDWTAIRAAAGLDGTGASVRDALFLELLDQHTALSWFAGPQRLSHLEAWGFDGADSNWEVTATFGGDASVHIVSLDKSADWAGLMSRFTERGYSTENHGEAVLRAAERDLFVDWQTASDSAMLNVATIEAQHLLIMADDMADVMRVVDVSTGRESSLEANEAVVATAGELKGTLSGVLRIGSDRCLGGGFAPLPPEVAATYLAGLQRYDVIGAGYFMDADAARVKAVLTFPEPTVADADVSARAGVAGAWGDAMNLFTLAAAEAVGSQVVLEFGLDRGPRPTLDDLLRGAAYTACL